MIKVPEDCPDNFWASLYFERFSFPMSHLHISRKTPSNTYERVADLEIYTPEILPERLIQHGTDVSSAMDLDHAVSVTRRWLQSCLKDHPVAYPGPMRARPSVLPSRILDISLSDSGNIFLIQKDEVGLLDGECDLRYATLSHCWDPGQNRQSTTTKNLTDRLNFIDVTELSRTFQDAILFAHALEIKYLWIDALCIIQDKHSDWVIESSLMGDIYGCSYLNIAATSGADGYHGLFNLRWAPDINTPTRRSLIDSIEIGLLKRASCVSKWDRVMMRCSLSRSHEDLTNPSDNIQVIGQVSPLLTRGWVFQERLLSLRTISFHASELTWDCQYGSKCECGALSSVDTTVNNITASRSGHFTKKKLTELSINVTGDHWHDFVSQYSTSRLTRASDYLPAISGIARHFELMRYDSSQKARKVYLAGLWSYNLSRDLCWYIQVSGNRCSPSRAEPYRAPSWSWASVDFTDQNARSPTVWHPNFQKSFQQYSRFEIRHAETQVTEKYYLRRGESDLRDRDQYGAVLGGILRIRGILIKAQVCVHPMKNRPNVGRHTIKFLEKNTLDEKCTDVQLPSLYLDISLVDIQEAQMSLQLSDISLILDKEVHDHAMKVLEEEASNQEEKLRVWICILGKIAGGGICALALRERNQGQANLRSFERVGYLHNETDTDTDDEWSRNFRRRVEREEEIVFDIW
ncbi:HET domain-containing protein [Sclerotinia borealis F-4128]|uniref:HET domain-containing protein n=1 Tax=Sclerotinia borealis (strain F-4128) TaxID=1432307 RepID=W9C8Y0_SCLBF|nr:HET domain-containing protein [Sclerotinia borealis F-4128]